MPITLYVIRSNENGRRYVGITSDLPRRLAEHRRKNTKAGQQLGEFALIHTEAFDSFREGRAREVFLKSGAGRAWLNQRYPRPANRPI